MNDTILEMKDLHVLFPVHKKWLPAVDGVNLKIEKGEITGVVGESGSGKSVMSQTILRLRDHDTNVRYEGEILFEGEDLLKQPLNKIRDIRGDPVSYTHLDVYKRQYRFSARAKNAGWRIDYFCVSESLKDRLEDAKILTDIMGSDHCPVELDIK